MIRAHDRVVLPDGTYDVVGEAEDYSHHPAGTLPQFSPRYEVGWRVFSESGEDAHGNPVRSWAEPVPVSVFGWAAPKSTEPKLAGHDRVIVDVELFVPPAHVVNLKKVTG